MRAIMLAGALAVACSTASADNLKTVIEDSFGCVSEEAFKDAESYLSNHETNLLMQALNSGQCVPLSKGQKVVLVDVGFLSYAIVRIPDDPTKLYTFFTIIK